MIYDKYNMFVKPEFTSLIKDVNIVFELGARNGLYTKEIDHYYNPSKIYSFECNPSSITTCIENTKDLHNVFFNNLAVCDYSGNIDFYQANTCEHADDGSSSIFNLSKLSGMKKVSVECTTLDDFCKANSIEKIDLICADIEGAEVKAFTDQSILHHTRYIITEVQINPSWKAECPTIVDLERTISQYGFEKAAYIDGCGHAGDALYINKRIVK